MKKYRLYITLFFSFSLHALLLVLLITHQKNLDFKKGIGEQRIKASFRTLSEIPQEALKSPLPPQPLVKNSQKTTPNQQKSKPKKQEIPKKQVEKIQKPLPKPLQSLQNPPKEEIKEKIEEKVEEEEIKEETKEDAPSLEQSLQAPLADMLENQIQQNSQEQTPPLPIEKTLAYQFADTYTKKNVSEIYGPEFGQLGVEEQEFILNNLSYIGRITQSYLRYPANAGMLKQEGMNVVEFYLHPNGDISDLKIIKPSGFILLDRNSTKTIEIAYKDYPHPKVKTLIRFYISYIMRPY